MSSIKGLSNNYRKHISIPWRSNAAAAQRVIFCVYDKECELRLRASIGEFELATNQADHGWAEFDLTDTFAEWLASQRYHKSYFEKPDVLTPLFPKYLEFITRKFEEFLAQKEVSQNSVVALIGVGSLFGILKVKDVVDRLAPLVAGRLLVFFPGSYEDKNYRLLDGYDGWNYLAIPITAEKEL